MTAGIPIVERFESFLLDLDGVVYVGDEPMPNAVESLVRLREAGKRLRFLTNNPRLTRLQVSRRLANMGVEAREEEVVTSGWATAHYLREEGISSAYVLGSRGLIAEVLGAGHRGRRRGSVRGGGRRGRRPRFLRTYTAGGGRHLLRRAVRRHQRRQHLSVTDRPAPGDRGNRRRRTDDHWRGARRHR